MYVRCSLYEVARLVSMKRLSVANAKLRPPNELTGNTGRLNRRLALAAHTYGTIKSYKVRPD